MVQGKVAAIRSDLDIVIARTMARDTAKLEPTGRKGIEIVCEDQGPGITDISLVMRDGYSTSRGMGMGLPGAKRLMDEFDIKSQEGVGTTIICRKWRS
jgi:serine/threonine-protein kinase RsbT